MLGKIISAAALTGAVAAASVIAKKKSSDFCPECDIKKAIAKAGIHIKSDERYDNGAALTPPMGWSSWNAFRNHIDENKILEIADAMKKSGLLEAGYQYVNLDDCWHSSMRDENGKLQGDLSTFPSGIKTLVEKLNEKGFKAGIYSSNGTLTCEDLPASLGHERIDAETFAEWGIEYFKYDFCHNKPIPSKAPLISEIIISSSDGNIICKKEAKDGILSGTANCFTDEKGSYIGRLDSGTGGVSFNLENVENEGEYILTVVIRKTGETEKYATVKVNGTDIYEVDFPPTKAWSTDGRVQLYIRLKQGENNILIKNPIGSKTDSAATQYIKMGKELKRATKLYAQKNNTAEKPIVYSICEWGRNRPWKWGAKAGNLWRTTPDIRPVWASVVGIYEATVRLYEYSGIGGWNDPDMLEVGNGKLTVEENKAHFTLWAMLAAPLILGNDIREFIKPDGTVDSDNKVLNILTNKDIIAIDQDKKGIQCRRIKTNGLTDILVKPLENKETAVCFFNKTKEEKEMSVYFKDIVNQSYVDMPESKCYEYTNLWTKESSQSTVSLNAKVPAHGVAVFRVKAIG